MVIDGRNGVKSGKSRPWEERLRPWGPEARGKRREVLRALGAVLRQSSRSMDPSFERAKSGFSFRRYASRLFVFG